MARQQHFESECSSLFYATLLSVVLRSWLNTLREEMGLLGFHCRKASEPTKGISAAVDALVSPRQALGTSTGGLHSANEV